MNIKIYEPSLNEDLKLLQWWLKMNRDGDLERTFTEECRPLGAFYASMRSPTILVLGTVGEKVELGAWMVPAMKGAFFGLWVARERRHSKSMFQQVVSVYSKALTLFPVLIGITKQEALLDAHRKLGYTVGDRMPGLFDGEDAWIVTLTKENFLWQAQTQAPSVAKLATGHHPALTQRVHDN